MNPDLHSHSHYSDGRHAPDFILQRARSNGVTHLALTDHDCINGLLELVDQGLPSDLALVSGVEISALWEAMEIHVVGLCFDMANAGMTRLLASQQQRRLVRARQIAERLSTAGIDGFEGYLEQLPCVSPSRTHAMEFLLERGIRRTHRQAFKLLSRQGRFYVKPDWCELGQAIESIRAAGGLAVLAHPHRYGLSTGALSRLLGEFSSLGGHGLEVVCSNMTASVQDRLVRLGEKFGLAASAGSDFHTSRATWMDLGRLPTMPEWGRKNAIWLHAGWHSLSS